MADEWKVGDEVALVSRYGGGYAGRTSKISKTYKNGNVLIEAAGLQQFKPIGNRRLEMTGDSRFGGSHYWAGLTNEVRAQAAADKAVRALGMMVRTKTCAAHIDAINAFLAAIAPDQEGA